jgi:hypothetical protein
MTKPIHSYHTPFHPRNTTETIAEAPKFVDYTDTHPPQYSAQSTTPPNYYQHPLKVPREQHTDVHWESGKGGTGELIPQHDKGICNDVTHAELQRRKRIVMDEVLEHQDSDRPRKTTRHKRKPDKQDDTGFPGHAASRVGIRVAG